MKRKTPAKKAPTLLKRKITAIALCEVVSAHYRTRELTRIVFVYPNVTTKDMFNPKDRGWKEGAVVRIWRPWSGFQVSGGSEERLPFMPRNKRTTTIQLPWKVDLDRPKTKKRPRPAAMDDGRMDLDIITLGKPPNKRPRLSADLQRKAKPLPLPSNTQMSIDELKKLPVGETVLVVKRFMVGAPRYG